MKGLEEIKQFGRQVEKATTTSVTDALREFQLILQRALQKSASLGASQYATGTLENTISTIPIKNESGTYIVSIEWEDYGDFVDQGVSGTETKRDTPFSYKDKQPPASAFSAFANNVGASPFAVAKSIFKHGFKGNKWATKVLEGGELDDYVRELESLIADNFEINITR